MDEHTIGLIHADIDGELDTNGRDALARALQASVEAQEYHARMQSVAGFLDSVPSQEPPAGLRERILASIELPSPRSRRRFPGLAIFPGLVRYGLAAAAGLLVAVGVYEMSPRPGEPLATSRMTGTVLPAREPSRGTLLAEAGVEADGLAGVARLVRRGETLVLDFSLDAGEPVRIDLTCMGEGLRFGSIAPNGSTLESVAIADRSIRLDAQGRQQFSVVLSRDAAATGESSVRLDWSRGTALLDSAEFGID